jgi:hypothetical protein
MSRTCCKPQKPTKDQSLQQVLDIFHTLLAGIMTKKEKIPSLL